MGIAKIRPNTKFIRSVNRTYRTTTRMPRRLRSLNLTTKRKQYVPIRVRVKRTGLGRPIRPLSSNLRRRPRHLIDSLQRSFPRLNRLRNTRIDSEVAICLTTRNHLIRPLAITINALRFNGRALKFLPNILTLATSISIRRHLYMLIMRTNCL